MCYTPSESQDKQNSYPWLRLTAEGGLVCDMCIRAGKLAKEGVYTRSVWFTGSCFHASTAKKLYIIKFFYHKVTKAHQNAVRILELAKSDHLPKLVEKSKSQYFRTTSRLTRTAYSVAKCKRPLVAFQELCELQEAIGLNQGIGLHSRYSGTHIINSISHAMKVKLCSAIVERGQKLSVMIDESTTVSKKFCLIIYVRSAWPFGDDRSG